MFKYITSCKIQKAHETGYPSAVMWSETVGLRTRPVSDQKHRFWLGLARCGLGLAGLVLLVSWCFTALSAQIGYIMPYKYEMYHIGPGESINIKCISCNKTTKEYNKPTQS